MRNLALKGLLFLSMAARSANTPYQQILEKFSAQGLSHDLSKFESPGATRDGKNEKYYVYEGFFDAKTRKLPCRVVLKKIVDQKKEYIRISIEGHSDEYQWVEFDQSQSSTSSTQGLSAFYGNQEDGMLLTKSESGGDLVALNSAGFGASACYVNLNKKNSYSTLPKYGPPKSSSEKNEFNRAMKQVAACFGSGVSRIDLLKQFGRTRKQEVSNCPVHEYVRMLEAALFRRDHKRYRFSVKYASCMARIGDDTTVFMPVKNPFFDGFDDKIMKYLIDYEVLAPESSFDKNWAEINKRHLKINTDTSIGIIYNAERLNAVAEVVRNFQKTKPAKTFHSLDLSDIKIKKIMPNAFLDKSKQKKIDWSLKDFALDSKINSPFINQEFKKNLQTFYSERIRSDVNYRAAARNCRASDPESMRISKKILSYLCRGIPLGVTFVPRSGIFEFKGDDGWNPLRFKKETQDLHASIITGFSHDRKSGQAYFEILTSWDEGTKENPHKSLIRISLDNACLLSGLEAYIVPDDPDPEKTQCSIRSDKVWCFQNFDSIPSESKPNKH